MLKKSQVGSTQSNKQMFLYTFKCIKYNVCFFLMIQGVQVTQDQKTSAGNFVLFVVNQIVIYYKL